MTTSTPLPSHDPSIRIERDEHVATVTIDRRSREAFVAYIERRPATFTGR